jgi:arylsulfatase
MTANKVINILKPYVKDDKFELVWGHFMDPHYPFTRSCIPDKDISVSHSSGKIEQYNAEFVNGSLDQSGLSTLADIYDEKIRYLDREIEELFNMLEAENSYENSLIIVVSDHGEAFGECGYQSHPWTADPIDTLIQTPIYVKYPELDQGGNTYSHPVQHSDISSTIASEHGSEALGRGFDLLNDRDRQIISISNNSIRLTTSTGQLIHRSDGTKELKGDIENLDFEYISSVSYPSIQNISGETPGSDVRDEREIEKQLEALGYK